MRNINGLIVIYGWIDGYRRMDSDRWIGHGWMMMEMAVWTVIDRWMDA